MKYSTPILTALMLALAAGTAVPATAQSSRVTTQDSAVVAPTVDFRTSKWLTDSKVVNSNNEEIANVTDLILDRGSGRIEYLVVKTGSTLGMGGRAVAIPYAAFKWEGAKNRLLLASTEEQLKQFPEFSAEHWTAMKDAAKEAKKDAKDARKEAQKDENSLRHRLSADAASPSDPYGSDIDTSAKASIDGEITNVERVRSSKFGEQVLITVRTADNATRRIALGPSWYVNSTTAAPMRGDKVVVETLVLPRDPDKLLAGTHIHSSGRELHLRETDGSPSWALKTFESDGQSYSAPYSRYLLLNNLPGARVDSRGIESGKVHEVILDRTSGEIAFLSIDPNENFLGISDTKRLVPWSVTTVALDGTVRIDASKEMVLASPETPADLSFLNTGTMAELAYKAYNVPAPRFEAPTPISTITPGKDSAWSAGGPIIGSIERNSEKTFEGKVVDITEVKFEKGVQSARALKIKLSGDGTGDEVILLGPEWYMANQTDMCKPGDSIRVVANRTVVDSRRYWIARSLDCKDRRVILLDKDNAPAWARP